MPKIWLTYAWVDNDDLDVDFARQELERAGAEVLIDRTHIVPGRHIWDQIEAALDDPDLDGWAIYLTRASLESPACREELRMAHLRVLERKGDRFMFLGIVPGPIDREALPLALRSRLWVQTSEPNWALRVVAAARGEAQFEQCDVLPYGHTWHPHGAGLILEIWPRAGVWFPALVMVPRFEVQRLRWAMPGPRGHPTQFGMGMTREVEWPGQPWSGIRVDGRQIDAQTSLAVGFSERPSDVIFGQIGQEMMRIIDQ